MRLVYWSLRPFRPSERGYLPDARLGDPPLWGARHLWVVCNVAEGHFGYARSDVRPRLDLFPALGRASVPGAIGEGTQITMTEFRAQHSAEFVARYLQGDHAGVLDEIHTIAAKSERPFAAYKSLIHDLLIKYGLAPIQIHGTSQDAATWARSPTRDRRKRAAPGHRSPRVKPDRAS